MLWILLPESTALEERLKWTRGVALVCLVILRARGAMSNDEGSSLAVDQGTAWGANVQLSTMESVQLAREPTAYSTSAAIEAVAHLVHHGEWLARHGRVFSLPLLLLLIAFQFGNVESCVEQAESRDHPKLQVEQE